MKAPLKIALIYCLIGILWILLSDQFLLVFLTKNELIALTYFQTIKGFLYVFLTALILYFLIRSNYLKQLGQISKLEEMNADLKLQRTINEKTFQNLKESEKKYSNLFLLCPLPLWVFDSVSYRFLDVNLAAINHYGYSREEFMEMTIMDIRPANEVNRTIDVLDNSLKGNNVYYKGVFQHVKKDGSVIDVEIRSDSFKYKDYSARLVLVNDVTELFKMQRSLKEAYENIIHSEDRERERFAGELHDGITQNLVAIKHFISMVETKDNDVKDQPIYPVLKELVDNSIKECRQIVYDMRPKILQESGLVGMIKSMCDNFNMVNGIHITYQFDDDIDDLIQPSIKFHIYRLIQENFNNTLKHANASLIELSFKYENSAFLIEFSDNGKGIDRDIIDNETSFMGIKHRLIPMNGEFKIENIVEGGIKFSYRIPTSIDEK